MTDIQWYAVMTGPRMEFTADANLRRDGYYTWLPHERVRKRRKAPGKPVYRVEWVNEPYFPRYLFVALRPSEGLYGVNEADGVMTVVYFGDEPLPVPHRVMDELMARADNNGKMGEKIFRRGQQVKFADETPLAGFLATVDLDMGKETRVFVDMLGKQVRMNVSPKSIIAAE